MPGVSNKRVTFSDTNMVYSPPTPSPTYSDISLPSTGGPITPPSFHKSPLPLPADMPVHIHPTLGLNPQTLPLLFDVSISPSAARTNTSPPSHLSDRTLLEAATYPPLNRLTLVTGLPWSLTIFASSQPYVTVIDVLEQLYRWLRLTVSQKEFDMESPASREAITAAFHQRFNRVWQTIAVEKKKGLKRVDFLKGHNRWVGLSSTKQGPTVWMLNVVQ